MVHMEALPHGATALVVPPEPVGVQLLGAMAAEVLQATVVDLHPGAMEAEALPVTAADRSPGVADRILLSATQLPLIGARRPAPCGSSR